eukprot:scaffold8616_cov169-Skeletonema_marinoi.AAC.2
MSGKNVRCVREFRPWCFSPPNTYVGTCRGALISLMRLGTLTAVSEVTYNVVCFANDTSNKSLSLVKDASLLSRPTMMRH